MNKKGGSFFFGAIIGLFVFIVGVLVIPFFTDDITIVRNDLDCTNVSISDATKVTCLEIDLVIPYFIWFFVSLAVGILIGVNK